MNELDHSKLITQIESLLDKARNQVAVQINNTLLVTYMEIGRLIVEDMMEHHDDEDYQKATITTISKDLTNKFGKGFSRANIWNMMAFYIIFKQKTHKSSACGMNANPLILYISSNSIRISLTNI